MTTMKEEMKPIDLGHLEDRAVMLRECLRRSQLTDRSEEYRAFFLRKAIMQSQALVDSFGYSFDTFIIGGTEPYSLSEPNR